ncbi:MAG: tetratricopeptide repeat protein, partial [bacterium]
LAIAQYESGNYSGAAESLERNLARGGPSGPHMDVFLAASYAQLGNKFLANAIFEKMQKENTGFPVEEWIGNFLSSEVHLRQTIEILRSLESLEP